MTARPFNGNAPAVSACCAVLDGIDVGHVERNEAVNLTRAVKERLSASNVAVAFFSNRAHKQNVTRRCDLCTVKRTQHLQHAAQPRSVVANTGPAVERAVLCHFEIRAGRENRIQMSGDREHRTSARAGASADHIARLIHHNIGEAIFTQELHDEFTANFFGKGRGFRLRNTDLLGHCAFNFLSTDLKSGLHGWKTAKRCNTLEHLGFKLRDMICHGISP